VGDELSRRLAALANDAGQATRVAAVASVRERGDRRRTRSVVRLGVLLVVTAGVLAAGGAVLISRGVHDPGRVANPAGSAAPSVADGAASPAVSNPDPPAPGGSASGPGVVPGCPAFPAFPDAACTGWRHTGVALRPCDTHLGTANASYDGCLFAGTVHIAAHHVSISRSRIAGRIETGLGGADLGGLTLADVEIDGGGAADLGQSALGNNNVTCLRCDIHGTARGVSVGSNVTVQDSFLHDFAPGTSGQSAIGSNGGTGNRFVHNTLQCNSQGHGCTAALALFGDDAPVHAILVRNNLFDADAGYCVYAGSAPGKANPHAVDVRFQDNRFGRRYSHQCAPDGPVAAWEYNAGNTWSGNRWSDDGTEVRP
jgi:hypothetical protein